MSAFNNAERAGFKPAASIAFAPCRSPRSPCSAKWAPPKVVFVLRPQPKARSSYMKGQPCWWIWELCGLPPHHSADAISKLAGWLRASLPALFAEMEQLWVVLPFVQAVVWRFWGRRQGSTCL